jgi:cation:H+ antiporter
MVAFTLTGPLTMTDGLLLLGLFVLFIAYVAARELRRSIPVFRDEEVYEAAVAEAGDGVHPRRGADTHALRDQPAGAAARTGAERAQQIVDDEPRIEARDLPGWVHLGLAVVALAGLVVGAATVSTGTEGILETHGLEGTVFGATIVTAVLTMEDVFLTVEPFRRGVPEIGVGNVVGSVVFSVTGKLGITLLAGGIVVGSDVFTWHLPSLVVLTALAAYLLSTGRLTRWHGGILLALYVVYWVVSLVAFGEVPVEMD